ncbi:hypothetical protein DPMN_119838 [Dreissena polymorpha]|uniref:Uncharacterized protein n=1 Tax=Dreissena polymorpha TaxID=45954 RepID=A0A9D4GQN2_DREPO|nr:hypothetical protein DPMN_119838 [Dreissena polymorpha]
MPHPYALFEAKNILRKEDKPQIVWAIRDDAADASGEALMNCNPEKRLLRA